MPGKYFPKQTGACGHPAQCATPTNDLITKSCHWPQQVVLGPRFVPFPPLGPVWLLSLLKFQIGEDSSCFHFFQELNSPVHFYLSLML